MANYPSSIDTFSVNPSGTSPLATGPDHANSHTVLQGAVNALENKLGIGSGSAASGQVLVGSGAGTSSWGSVWNNGVLGSPTLTGGTATAQVNNNGTLGSPAITGGTANNQIMGSPAITGGTARSFTITNPDNTVSYAALTNPYKFSVYRTAAQNTGNGATTVILFDTKSFDTGSNVDIVTNKGRFTAPVAGFYQFNARFSVSAVNSLNRVIIGLFKNGTGNAVADGGDITATDTFIGISVSHLIQLAANDYVEVGAFGSTALAMEVGIQKTYFSGFLVSAT